MKELQLWSKQKLKKNSYHLIHQKAAASGPLGPPSGYALVPSLLASAVTPPPRPVRLHTSVHNTGDQNLLVCHGGQDIAQRPPGALPRGPRRPRHADQGQRGRLGGDPGEHLQELGERAPARRGEGGRPGGGPEDGREAVRPRRGPPGQADQAGVEQEAGEPAPLPGERGGCPQRHRAGRGAASEHR